MEGETLAQALKRRIEETGISQRRFAERVGLSSSHMNSLVSGKIGLPQPEVRRRLARELGISHVDLLVMAGELRPDEVDAAGVQGVVPESPAEAALLPVIRSFDWTDAQLRAAAGALRAIGDMGRREG
jgi:transcriptional regulator with XRE-family HTH domain